MEKDCYNCKNKTTISQADLYGATTIYGCGDIYDWCSAYNISIDQILEFDPELKKCNQFEKEGVGVNEKTKTVKVED